jgi:sulfur carrier protein
MKPMIPPVAVTVNGEEKLYRIAPTVRGLLAELGLPERGVAVAVDGAVFPKSRWGEKLLAGWQIEILTAVQGG